MRLVGTFEEEMRAQVFYDYLYLKGLESHLNLENEDADIKIWNVWVIDSEHVPEAKELLKTYRKDPDAKEFQGVSELAQKKRAAEQKDKEVFREKVHDREKLFSGTQLGTLTISLIVVCVAVALLSQMGKNREFLNYLFITRMKVVGNYIHWYKGLPDIFRHGEIWRLFTPMFIHFGFLHLIFNMLWLKDLGSLIEKRQNPWILGALVFIIALVSNLAQYYMSGPSFGGMSGVVYGLLGYVWVRGRYDPRSGLHIGKETVIMMIIWFFLCLSGLIGNIANTAHAVGLVMGMSWGFLTAQWATQPKHPN